VLDLHQDHDGRRNRDRRRCMHDDAKRAVVGVGIHLMYVDDLDNGEQCEEDQTYDSNQRQGTWP
jgi:hypothetical protein